MGRGMLDAPAWYPFARGSEVPFRMRTIPVHESIKGCSIPAFFLTVTALDFSAFVPH